MPREVVPLRNVLAFLESRRGWVDGVVISGGEPTVHPELPEFLAAFKSRGMLVKLDTNGTAPGMLSDLVDMGLLDYVAMDLKAPLTEERYARATGGAAELRAVERSVELLLSGRVGYEFRTTVCPGIAELGDLPAMARAIAGASCYVLQQFVPETALNPALRTASPYPKEELIAAAARLEGVVRRCFVRGEGTAPAMANSGQGVAGVRAN
jgi:pyruvate formate lyase activating enzyme